MRSVLLIGGATLLALLLLLTLLTLSRRHYLDRIALEAEAKRQLEERVLERTRELENANAQLQQEVHEREQAQRELDARPGRSGPGRQAHGPRHHVGEHQP